MTNKGGRPRKEIDAKQFEKLCALQCTKEEFCCYFDVTDKTLESWCKRTYGSGFSDTFKLKRGAGKISLRRKQYEVALSGNPTMLIWLGRNMLNQTDKISLAFDENANGHLAELIDGLKEPVKDDIYTEAKSVDGVVEDK